MGLIVTPSTMPGGQTPICNDCGILLCWDLDDETATAQAAFWNAWRCETCDPHARGSRKRAQANGLIPSTPGR